MRKILAITLLLAGCWLNVGAQTNTPQKDSSPNQSAAPQSDRGISQKAEDRIIKEVRHELVMLPNLSLWDNLAYKVDGYKVTLLGQVRNASLKSEAENAVKHIEGVEQVDNQIQVLPPSPNDDRIRREVARAIFGADRCVAVSPSDTAPALIALEAKFATHGVVGIGGIAMLTLGALLLVDGPIPEMRVNLWTALAVSIPFGLITVFLMNVALRARRNKITTGAQGLVGETGIARTPLLPDGKVFLHGEIWDAVASSNIETGQRVVVRHLDGLRLHVDPASAVPR